MTGGLRAPARLRVHIPKLSFRVETFGPWRTRELIGDPEIDPAVPQSYLCVELAPRH